MDYTESTRNMDNIVVNVLSFEGKRLFYTTGFPRLHVYHRRGHLTPSLLLNRNLNFQQSFPPVTGHGHVNFVNLKDGASNTHVIFP